MKWISHPAGARCPLRTTLALTLLVLGAASPLHAQYEVKSGVYNRLSNRVPANNPAGIAPVGPAGTPSGEPAITPQFSNVVESSGSAGPGANGYPNSVVSGVGVNLTRASFGTSFASGVPRYLFGDEIKPPTVIVDKNGNNYTVDSSYWRAQPVLAGEVISNPGGGSPVDFKTGDSAAVAALPAGVLASYYYSPHAKRVFANTPGTVEITWRSALPDPAKTGSNSYVFLKERFTVSSTTATPVRTMYWTEKSFTGPVINIPSGRITTVNPVYSNVFPATVASEYVVAGVSQSDDPNASSTRILRTLWYESNAGSGKLRAYNHTGRIFVEYLGALNSQDGTYEFLGADIIGVEQSLRASTLEVELGHEIRPFPDEPALVATPVSISNTVNQIGYYGTIARPDGSLAYFAEQENLVEDNVAFYWMEPLDAGIPTSPLTPTTQEQFPGLVISWPKHQNKYLQVWPKNITDFAHYSVDNGGSSLATNTGLQFGGGRIPQIIYQDSTVGEASIDVGSQRLIVNLGQSVDQKNRTLLKFTGSNGGVWYVPLLTQAEDRDGYEEGDGGARLEGTVWVGERVNPPSSAYTLAGYISSGTSYSPQAYVDPFLNGVPAAEKGAIIPVNALPGAQTGLTVWWFKKVEPPSAEFEAFYSPAKIARYVVEYRATHQAAAENFETSAGGWSNPTRTTTGGTGGFLGPFGVYPDNRTRNIPVTSQTYSLGGNYENRAKISFKFHRLDSWDGESFKVFVNGAQLISESFNMNQVTVALQGTALSSGISYAWSMTPVQGSYFNYYGNAAWPEQAFLVNIVATPTSLSAAETLATLTVGVGSTLDQDPNDESFGIDDFSIRNPLPRIVLASRMGTGALPSAVAAGSIYRQADPAKPGYNPNEEHALLLGSSAYALRDDLNIISGTTFSSLPRVLVQYTDPNDQRPAMSVFEVLREDTFHTFSYPVTAGTRMDAIMPAPLGTLPLPLDPTSGIVRNVEVDPGASYHEAATPVAGADFYKKFTYKDRKGYDWVYRGPMNGGTPALGMNFYYNMQASFDFPSGLNVVRPAVGSVLPYLRPLNGDGTYAGDPVTGTPATILYFPTWPTNPPALSVAETLALSKNGLPAVRGQTSARVLYQQSIALSGTSAPSVTLHDPTRAKTVLLNNTAVGLTALPSSLKTTSQKGKTYFQLAPPHLQQRFYLNPQLGDIGGLVLEGEFVDEIAGDDYLNLNTLSLDDANALKGLVTSGNAGNADDDDKSKWDKAIDALSTRMETFKEDPAKRGTYIVDSPKSVDVGAQSLPEVSDSDTAVDSYALTATGKGSGYVTLLFSDGEAFTPPGNGVDMKIIKVVPHLYQGDLKKLLSSNPLDEQVTLRHSGDFAAHPENYEFEWYYATSSGGASPAIYTYQTERVIGKPEEPATNGWFLFTNPAAAPSAAVPLVYPTTPETLPKSYQVNNNTYTAGLGLPGRVFKSVSGLSLTGSVPDQIVFSADIGSHDGFLLYVNGVPALAYQLPSGTLIPGNLTPQPARSGITADGLGYQFEVAPSFFKVGNNQLEVALYSPNGANSPFHMVDFRVHVPRKQDLVTGSTQWTKALAPSNQPPLTNTVMIGGSANSIAGNSLLVFSDNYFTMRYKPKAGNNMVASSETWSEWMEPVLVESWVKRVLAGINPFIQRNTDLYNNPVSTDVSVLTQAGKRWEGDVALNLNNINDFGLIEIYETVLNRVKAQSLDAGVSNTAVNQTLQLAAGYLSDLYMTLGNEAWDDAQNPTLLIDGQLDPSEISSARFSFEGQVATMMEETLGLLRGRDDFGTKTNIAPAYNRLYWNYIKGIKSGEPIYAVNYGIQEKPGSANGNGVIDASDAQAMFPQGHGDAYGHYLTALTGYYKLLTNEHFDWVPKAETVSVLGQTVEVDYKDERKFATAAAALARTGKDILDYTARKDHQDGEENGWSRFHEAKTNPNTGKTRHWGVDEWSSRTFQGAYLNWVTANAMLPDVDNSNEGIEKIDRTTVPELGELVSSGRSILSLSAGLQAHLNPLGLAHDAMTFDISPSEVAAGKSHFEQIYERAIKASVNAKNAFHQAGKMNQQLRQQNNSLDEYNDAITRQEAAYEYQLISLYGTAYAGDMGPGKLYPQGYTGPDLYHSYFLDRPSPIVNTDSTVTVTFREPINTKPFSDWTLNAPNDRLNDHTKYTDRTYTISKFSLGQFSDTVTTGLGKRGQTGTIQSALLDCYEAQVNLRDSSSQFTTLVNRFNRDYQLYSEYESDFETADAASSAESAKAKEIRTAMLSLSAIANAAHFTYDYFGLFGEAASKTLPLSVGTANDVTSALRSAIDISALTAAGAVGIVGVTFETTAAVLELKAAASDDNAAGIMDEYTRTAANKQHIVELERLYDEVLATGFEMTRRLTELQRASEKVSRLYGDAAHLLTERESFRQRAASVIQGYRTRDVVYRDMRNEELSQYKGLFDLAQTYTYLAAKSYDYETGLLDTTQGEEVVNEIIGTYAVGDFEGDNPVLTSSGDAGLAGVLGQLNDDWSIVKGRLGINNPDRNGTVFSLRQELFRIRTDQATADDNILWKQVLQQHIMSNVLNDPDAAIYCNNLRKANGNAVPGMVIPFSTTIEQGLNFFGWPLAPGDHAYTQSNFATKIASAGLVFRGYVGMDAYATGIFGAAGPASSAPNALSATPYAYLIPAGVDTMRSPPLGDTNRIRSWSVKDQAIPLPRNLGANLFSSNQFFTPDGSLNEDLWIRRKHGAFRAVNDPAYFYSSIPAEFTNSRLIGRSVWNSQWKIVIPAYSLLNDEQAALDRFTQSVTDIQLFLRSYSNSGN